jgi:hypothetical protein
MRGDLSLTRAEIVAAVTDYLRKRGLLPEPGRVDEVSETGTGFVVEVDWDPDPEEDDGHVPSR